MRLRSTSRFLVRYALHRAGMLEVCQSRVIPSVMCASVADARADRARYAEIGPYRVCLVNFVLTFGGGNTVRKTGPNGSTNEGAFGNVADFNDHSCRLCRLCRGPFQKSHSG